MLAALSVLPASTLRKGAGLSKVDRNYIRILVEEAKGNAPRITDALSRLVKRVYERMRQCNVRLHPTVARAMAAEFAESEDELIAILASDAPSDIKRMARERHYQRQFEIARKYAKEPSAASRHALVLL